MPLGLIAAAVLAAADAPRGELTPLDAAEIAGRFENTLFHPPLTGDMDEAFGPDGGYTLLAYRTRPQGRWWSRDGELCVELQGADRCRRVVHDDDGAIFFVGETVSGVSLAAEPVRVELKPLRP